jgi:AraC-like DNA-binding protein
MGDAYREIAPGPMLRQYVECFWSSLNFESAPPRHILPDGCVDILFSAGHGEPISLAVVGLMTRPLAHPVKAGDRFFGVRFRPGMASAIIPEAPLLNDRIEPLECFWGSRARPLFENLAASSSPREAVQHFERVLRPRADADSSLHVVSRLSDSATPLAVLASDAGLSSRHFRRTCVAHAGVPPKYLRRILRFRRAADRIRTMRRQPGQPNWADFAAELGYFDQAHLIREFREFGGCTPVRFVQSLPARGSLSSEHDGTRQTEQSD